MNNSDKVKTPEPAAVTPPELLTVSPSPHIKHADTTSTIMLDVVFALTPALLYAVYVFGARALSVTLICVASCMTFEYAWQRLMKKPVTIMDFSAVVTGLLIAMNLPVSVPLWMPVMGAFFAIIVVKQLFGGLGKNIVNPALAARVFLFAWPEFMNTFTAPHAPLSPFVITLKEADVVATATPLAEMSAGNTSSYTVFDLFIGNLGGSMGEISALLLTAGGIYLLLRKVISWRIPVSFIGTVALLSFVFPQVGGRVDFMLYQIFAGGLFLGAIFMATDYVTSPITNRGKLIFGAGCGLITVLIRFFGGYPEGVSFSILVMNTLVWYLDKFTKPRVFGGGQNVAK